jgi:hypothetical protein
MVLLKSAQQPIIMKKILKFSGLTIALLIVSLFIINQFTMRSIRTEIEINAPIEDVWTVLMDHQAYPEWNPFVKKISGSTTPGDHLQVTLQSEGNKPMDFKPKVLVNKTNEEFRWIGKLGFKGVFDGEHYFLVEAIGPNQTKFIQGEKFTGILSGILMKMIGDDTIAGFNSMNEALKSRSENN